MVHGGALAALDWGLGGARAAGDGGQQGRRRSGDEMELGKRNAEEKEDGNRQTRSQSDLRVRVKAESGATAQAGAVMVARCVAAGGRLGIAWRSHGRAAGEEE
jgi:hypothetical protein